MAIEHKGDTGSPYTVTAAAAKLSTIMGLPSVTVDAGIPAAPLPGDEVRVITFWAPTANAAIVYIGPTNQVTAAGAKATIALEAGKGYAVDAGSGFINTDSFWIIGTPSDKVFIAYYV